MGKFCFLLLLACASLSATASFLVDHSDRVLSAFYRFRPYLLGRADSANPSDFSTWHMDQLQAVLNQRMSGNVDTKTHAKEVVKGDEALCGKRKGIERTRLDKEAYYRKTSGAASRFLARFATQKVIEELHISGVIMPDIKLVILDDSSKVFFLGGRQQRGL